MGVRAENSTDYVHSDEPNLLNLHKAMEYNGLGQPIIRVKAGFGGSGGDYNDSTATDAFGRLRISDAFTLFDSSFRFSDDLAKWNSATSGSATKTYDANACTINMNVTTTGDQVIRETRCVFQYQPGKSLLVMNTFVMASPQTGLRQRIGYFGANNGIYFMTEDTTKYFVIRKATGGSVDDTTEKVAQSNWNIDPLDGTGPSKITLDVTKTQIFWMDIEWLGVGSVRLGFVINGVFVPCHVYHHANSFTLPYMQTASLPLRAEITATGAVAATMRVICSTIISEGGYEPKAIFSGASMGVNTKNLVTKGTYYPLIAFRLASGRTDAIVRLAQLQSMIATSSSAPKNCHWQLLLNPTLTGSPSWQSTTNGIVEYDTSASGFTGGTVITQGYFSASTRVELGSTSDFNQQFSRTIAGVSDVLLFVAAPDSNGLDVALDVGWFELS